MMKITFTARILNEIDLAKIHFESGNKWVFIPTVFVENFTICYRCLYYKPICPDM